MKKFICSVCGYIHEGDEAPEKCPICSASKEKFQEKSGALQWADEHYIGVASAVDPAIIEDLRANFVAECTEVGMYLAMGRQAYREGYPEVGLTYDKIAYEEAHHASIFAELLGEVVKPNTKSNLIARLDAEYGACEGKKKLATITKAQNLDAIHDAVHEMSKDEARHGKTFEGLLKRYFQE